MLKRAHLAVMLLAWAITAGTPSSSAVNIPETDAASRAAIPLSDPLLPLFQSAIEMGCGRDEVLTMSPFSAGTVDGILRRAGHALDDCPDGDGLLRPPGLDGGAAVLGWPVDAAGTFRLARPLDVSLGGADLLVGESGPRRYSDGDRYEEGAYGRARASALWAPSSHVHLAATGRLETGRTATRLRWTRAVAVLRLSGVRVTLGRDPRWWGPGTLNELLLTTNALAADGVEIATDGTQRLPLLGPYRLSVFLVYLDDAGRPTSYPLLFGHRAAWRPLSWAELGAERTIMLGGADRTRRYTASDLWNILLGRRENRVDYMGYQDTDQKVGLDISLYLHPLVGHVPGLTGGRVSYRYAGDDSFEGILPTRVAHSWNATLLFPRIRLEMTQFGNVAGGLWYWNNEYPAGYTYHGDFLASDLGWDAGSLRARATVALERDTGVRLEIFRDSRGYRFHQGPGLEPERGERLHHATELGLALTRRVASGLRTTVEYRYRDASGFAYDLDRRHPRHVATVTVSAS